MDARVMGWVVGFLSILHRFDAVRFMGYKKAYSWAYFRIVVTAFPSFCVGLLRPTALRIPKFYGGVGAYVPMLLLFFPIYPFWHVLLLSELSLPWLSVYNKGVATANRSRPREFVACVLVSLPRLFLFWRVGLLGSGRFRIPLLSPLMNGFLRSAVLASPVTWLSSTSGPSVMSKALYTIPLPTFRPPSVGDRPGVLSLVRLASPLPRRFPSLPFV